MIANVLPFVRWSFFLTAGVVATLLWAGNGCAAEQDPSAPTPTGTEPFSYSLTFPANGGVNVDFSDNSREKLGMARKPDGTDAFDFGAFLRKLRLQVLADAATGKEPAVWDAGVFYLYGLGGEWDLPKADAALRQGLSRRQLQMVEPAVTLASWYIYGNPQEKQPGILEKLSRFLDHSGDLAAAESLLSAVAAVAPEHPRYEMVRAELLFHQKRYAEADVFFAKALQKLAPLPESRADCELIRNYRFLCAFKRGDFSALGPQEVLSRLSKSSQILGRWVWMVPVSLALVLTGLVGWAWRCRAPGFLLTACWNLVSSYASVLGFQAQLGVFGDAGRWYGAIAVALAAGLAAAISAPKRYFGEGPLWTSGCWRTIGLLATIILGMLALHNGYVWLYQRITGHPLNAQFVAFLLKCETWSQLVVALAAAGVAIPFYEEMFFRGFLFDALERRWGIGWALGGSSAVFALVHGLAVAPLIFVMGLVLGWLRWRRGNLRACIALHAMNNSLAIWLLWFWHR